MLLDCSEMTDSQLADLLRAVREAVRPRMDQASGVRKIELREGLASLNEAIGLVEG